MNIALLGPATGGKTTLFNALTRGAAAAGPSGRGQANVGVVKVPDPRLEPLQRIFGARRPVHAEVTFVDVPDKRGDGDGTAGQYLNEYQRADAIIIVVRSFEDPSGPYGESGIDPLRDAESAMSELALADLVILERRLARLAESAKGARAAERELLKREEALISRLNSELEAGAAIRDLTLTRDETRQLEGFGFLTAKPVIVVANLGEDQIGDADAFGTRLSERIEGPKVRTAAVCGKLEMELSEMDPEEQAEFRESLGLDGHGLGRVLELCQSVLEMVTFLTGGEKEVRAWQVADGTEAVRAAGKVHTDMERGFIRAEVVAFDDLADCGGFTEARKRGLLRQEGKTYPVRDGDVINFLFNV